MIEFFHKYQRSIIIYIFVVAIVISMTLFDVNSSVSRSRDYAIRVNDTEISYDDIQTRKRAMEDQLRKQFGEQAEQLMPIFLRNSEQRIVDQYVSESLVDQFVAGQHLTTAPADVVNQIKNIFGGQFNQANYLSYLREVNLTAAQFEQRLDKDLTRAQFSSILADFSKASRYEARLAAGEEEKKIDVSWIELDPAVLQKEVAKPEAGKLEEFYNENKARYEIPERVKFNAVALSSNDFEKDVIVAPEDIELYYTQYETEFYEPEKALVSHIELHYPKDNSPAGMLAVKEKAQEIQGKAMAGEDFSALVAEYSEDLTSKLNKGSLGWITKGERDDALAKAVFAYAATGVPEVIEADYGFHIVNIEDFQARKPKSLDSVSAQITKLIQQREAPAYTQIKGEELFTVWTTSNTSLADYAKQNNLRLIEAKDYLQGDTEIAAGLDGLNKRVFENPGEAKQYLELGNKIVLVEVLDYQESNIPEFAKVQEQVLADWKLQQARELARARAEKIVAALDQGKSLLEAGRAEGLKVTSEKALARNDKDRNAVVAKGELGQTVFKTKQTGLVSKTLLSAGDKLALVFVDNIHVAKDTELKTKLEDYQKRLSQADHNALIDSIVNRLKIKSEIDIAPGLIATTEEV